MSVAIDGTTLTAEQVVRVARADGEAGFAAATRSEERRVG